MQKKPDIATRFAFAVCFMLLLMAKVGTAEEAIVDLPLTEPARWSYVSDQVMGGVSEGTAQFEAQDGRLVLRLTGEVSTANRGGFVQVRTSLTDPLSDTAEGVVLRVRGNDQTYFVHLRTRGTALPWQYYQASFEATGSWREVRLPFTAFAPSGGLLRKTPRPSGIQSLGIVAYGRDHIADVSVSAVGFY